jgi:hypothetical protein
MGGYSSVYGGYSNLDSGHEVLNEQRGQSKGRSTERL